MRERQREGERERQRQGEKVIKRVGERVIKRVVGEREEERERNALS